MSLQTTIVLSVPQHKVLAPLMTACGIRGAFRLKLDPDQVRALRERLEQTTPAELFDLAPGQSMSTRQYRTREGIFNQLLNATYREVDPG